MAVSARAIGNVPYSSSGTEPASTYRQLLLRGGGPSSAIPSTPAANALSAPFTSVPVPLQLAISSRPPTMMIKAALKVRLVTSSGDFSFDYHHLTSLSAKDYHPRQPNSPQVHYLFSHTTVPPAIHSIATLPPRPPGARNLQLPPRNAKNRSFQEFKFPPPGSSGLHPWLRTISLPTSLCSMTAATGLTCRPQHVQLQPELPTKTKLTPFRPFSLYRLPSTKLHPQVHFHLDFDSLPTSPICIPSSDGVRRARYHPQVPTL